MHGVHTHESRTTDSSYEVAYMVSRPNSASEIKRFYYGQFLQMRRIYDSDAERIF